MGIINHLDIGEIYVRGTSELAQFRWGFLRGLQYSLGDRLIWDPWPRPAEANGDIIVGGCYGEVQFGKLMRLDYIRIQIRDDVIITFEPSSEEEFERLEIVTEAVLSDVITKFMASQRD